MSIPSKVPRIDRMLTVGLVGPLQHRCGCQSRGIPILMYHSISDDPQRWAHPYYQTSTSTNTFRKHMNFLKCNRYSVVSLRKAVGLLQTPQMMFNVKPVVLTFDDGFKDFYTEAFPILKEYGFPSTVFLPTTYLDNPSSEFKGRSCLSWDQVRELHKLGVDFGSHTVTHPDLTVIRLDQLEAEIKLSRERIEHELGIRVDSFSYPFAFPEDDANFTNTLKRLLYSAGYLYGVTTKLGVATGHQDPMFLKRIPLNQSDDIELLQAKLAGAYDWVYPLQRLFKWMKRKRRALCARAIIPWIR